jgi:multidrug transporter EmrE-like cation transporter
MNEIRTWLELIAVLSFTVYSQVILKWQIDLSKHNASSLLESYFGLFTNPWVWSICVAIAGAGFCWFLVLRDFELSFAYPLLSVTYAAVLLVSWLWLGESLSVQKVGGVALIICGIVLSSRA